MTSLTGEDDKYIKCVRGLAEFGEVPRGKFSPDDDMYIFVSIGAPQWVWVSMPCYPFHTCRRAYFYSNPGHARGSSGAERTYGVIHAVRGRQQVGLLPSHGRVKSSQQVGKELGAHTLNTYTTYVSAVHNTEIASWCVLNVIPAASESTL